MHVITHGYGWYTHCEAWCELLDVIKRHVNRHYAKNQLILVLMGSMREKIRTDTSPHMMRSCIHLLYLLVSFIYGLGSVEDRQCSSDDETELLIENKAKALFNNILEQRTFLSKIGAFFI